MAGTDGSDTSSTVYLDDLNPVNPESTDPKSQGDDHIRFIKRTLKNTFPNIDGIVSATQTELNYNDITTLGTQQASKVLTADANNTLTVPSGGEINFASGSQLQIGGVAVTSSATELNTLDGVNATLTAAELNILDGVTATTAEINYLSGVTSAIQTQLAGKLSSTPTFGIQFNLDYGENATFTIDQYATFAYTINSAVYQTASGTITANVKINGTSVTGLSALSLASTEAGPTTASAANSVAIGDTVSITLSSNSSAVKASIKLNCTRA